MSVPIVSSDPWGEFDEVDLGGKQKKKGLLPRKDSHDAIRPRFFSGTALEKIQRFLCCCSCKRRKTGITASECSEL